MFNTEWRVILRLYLAHLYCVRLSIGDKCDTKSVHNALGIYCTGLVLVSNTILLTQACYLYSNAIHVTCSNKHLKYSYWNIDPDSHQELIQSKVS